MILSPNASSVGSIEALKIRISLLQYAINLLPICIYNYIYIYFMKL